MTKTFSTQIPASSSDNRKSKTCPEPSRRIENLKLVGIFALALTFALGGAVVEARQEEDGKGISHRFPGWEQCGCDGGPRGSVPARAEQAWMD